MNKTRKIPLRQCIACRQQRPKRELVRIVRDPHGKLLFDPKGKTSGRGAYLCVSSQCLGAALKGKLFKRHLNVEPSPELVERLESLIGDDRED